MSKAAPFVTPSKHPRRHTCQMFSRRTRGYQTNWQTVQIGQKWWGLSAARMYDFTSGRFTHRDPLSELVRLKSMSKVSILGKFDGSVFSRALFSKIYLNTGVQILLTNDYNYSNVSINDILMHQD